MANGVANIDGVDRQLIETFSQRRAAIVEHAPAGDGGEVAPDGAAHSQRPGRADPTLRVSIERS